eukprot:Gb_10185 [translate_table: standard]
MIAISASWKLSLMPRWSLYYDPFCSNVRIRGFVRITKDMMQQKEDTFARNFLQELKLLIESEFTPVLHIASPCQWGNKYIQYNGSTTNADGALKMCQVVQASSTAIKSPRAYLMVPSAEESSMDG